MRSIKVSNLVRHIKNKKRDRIDYYNEEEIKKIILAITIVLTLTLAYFCVRYVRINASIDSFTGKEWKTVTMYSYGGTEMELTAEEIEQLHAVFEGVEVTLNLYTPIEEVLYGTIDFHPFYVNGKRFQVIASGRMVCDSLPYNISGNTEYTSEYRDLKIQFAKARGLE